jgi:hypothetical protein
MAAHIYSHQERQNFLVMLGGCSPAAPHAFRFFFYPGIDDASFPARGFHAYAA